MRSELHYLEPASGSCDISLRSAWEGERSLDLPVPDLMLPGQECLEIIGGTGELLAVDGFSPRSIPLQGWWYQTTPAVDGTPTFLSFAHPNPSSVTFPFGIGQKDNESSNQRRKSEGSGQQGLLSHYIGKADGRAESSV